MVEECLLLMEAPPEEEQAQATALGVCLPMVGVQTLQLTREVANPLLTEEWAMRLVPQTLHTRLPRTTTRPLTASTLEDQTRASSPDYCTDIDEKNSS